MSNTTTINKITTIFKDGDKEIFTLENGQIFNEMNGIKRLVKSFGMYDTEDLESMWHDIIQCTKEDKERGCLFSLPEMKIKDVRFEYVKPDGKMYMNNTIADLAMKASISTLKAIFYSTNDPKVGEMFFGLLQDSQKINNNNIMDYTVSDGYDCFLVAYSFLLNEYNNGNNVDTLETRQRAKTGYHMIDGKKVYCTPIKIASKFYWMCSELRKYIYSNGQTDYKRTYVECKTDKDGHTESPDEATDRMLYQVGRYYDIDNERGVVVYEKLLKACKDLTPRQQLILHYRFQGKGTNEIAEILGVKHNTISSHLEAIQDRIRKSYPEAVAVCIDRVAKAK